MVTIRTAFLNMAMGKMHRVKQAFFQTSWKEKVLCQKTGDEQGQPRVNAAALFRDLNIDPRQRKSETMSNDRDSHEAEQGVACFCGAFLQNGCDVLVPARAGEGS